MAVMPLETAPPATKIAAIPAMAMTTMTMPTVNDLETPSRKIIHRTRESVKKIFRGRLGL